MTDNVRTREALERTFAAACRASTSARIPLESPANIAGLLLHTHGSAADALAAVRRMPPGDVWSTVYRYLDDLAAEEVADTQRPKATG